MIRLRPLALGAMCAAVLLCGAFPSLAFDDRTPRVHALVGARVVVSPGRTLEQATIVVRDGIIEAVGNVEPPADARIWELHGKTVYAGLIEPYFDPAAGANKKDKGDAKTSDGDAGGVRHPNPNVRAEQRVVETLDLSDEQLEKLRAGGWAVAHMVPSKGIFRGQSALLALRAGTPEQQVLRADAAHVVAFQHGSWGDADYRKNPTYPSALMGAVATVRQAFLDAQWAQDGQARYASRRNGFERPQSNLSWDALASALPNASHQPVWFVTKDVLGSLRSAQLAQEFELSAVLVGNGEEYQYLDEVHAAGQPIVLPVNYPKAPEVEDDDEALDIELDELRHWERAPSNASRLHAKGADISLTAHGLKERADFRKRVAKAIERGLPADAALAAVTTAPAKLLGFEQKLGSIERGKIANLTVTQGDLFDPKADILEVWVDGDRYVVRDKKRDDFAQVRGAWKITAGDAEAPSKEWTLDVKGNEWTMRATLEDARGSIPVRRLAWQHGELLVELSDNETLRLKPLGKKELKGSWRRSGTTTDVEASRPEPAMGGAR